MPRRRLLIVNYTTDDTHSALSHQNEVAYALSQKFESTAIITSDSSSGLQSSNTLQILNLNWQEHGFVRKLLKTYSVALKILVFFRPTHVFYHMVDTQCAIISPLFYFSRAHQVLWYAHKKKTLPLVISSFFVNAIATSTLESFPPHPKRIAMKLHVIGQGIKEEAFPRLWNSEKRPDSAICVGRLDPSKGFVEIIETLGRSFSETTKFKVAFAGVASSVESSKLISDAINEFRVKYPHISIEILGSIKRQELAQTMSKYGFFIHAFRGSLDKVLLEATLTGIPVVTINSGYQNEFGTWSGSLTDDLLVELSSFLSTSKEAVFTLNKSRRLICVKKHSFEGWIRSLNLVLGNKCEDV